MCFGTSVSKHLLCFRHQTDDQESCFCLLDAIKYVKLSVYYFLVTQEDLTEICTAVVQCVGLILHPKTFTLNPNLKFSKH